MGETVTGRVTVHLEDARWADAMAAVLQSQGLGADLEGTVLFVDTLEQLARASADRRARADATAALAPLVTRLIPVHHARAAELAPLVKASLSPRGSVRVDERTNTLIVTDIAEP
jgi:type IV pilus assembly protein PilQ